MFKDEVLNLVSIIFSFICAALFPIELFVLAYAILGPLHYLTEISWLHDKKNFLASSKLSLFYYALALVSISSLFGTSGLFFYSLSLLLILTAFLLWFKSNKIFLSYSVVIFIALHFLMLEFKINIILLIPTMVHVYFFTLLFVYLGTLKNSNTVSKMSLLLLIVFPPVLFLFGDMTPVVVSKPLFLTALNEYDISFNIIELTPIELNEKNLYQIMRVISFCFLYHYLNWFIKIKTIRWNNISIQRLTGIIAIYLFILSTYAIDFKYGLICSLYLSVLHVFLELPLNFTTIKKVFTPA